MTILNVWLTAAKALIAVDTRTAADPAGRTPECSKLLVLPHLSVALAFRGRAVFMTRVFAAVHQQAVSNFHELVERMPAILASEFRRTRRRFWLLFKLCGPSFEDGQTVVLVGWDGEAGEPVGWEFTQESRKVGFVRSRIYPYHIAPWDPSIDERCQNVSTPSAMMALAAAQIHLAKELVPDQATGGRLILCEITRRGLAIWDAGKISEGTQ